MWVKELIIVRSGLAVAEGKLKGTLTGERGQWYGFETDGIHRSDL